MERPWAEQAEFDRVPPEARGEGQTPSQWRQNKLTQTLRFLSRDSSVANDAVLASRLPRASPSKTTRSTPATRSDNNTATQTNNKIKI